MKAIVRVFRDEFRRVFALRPVFSVLVVGSAFYAVFYPQPYLNEALRNVPIAIVDGDGTSASRELGRRIDATSDIAVTTVLPDVVSAEREVGLRIKHRIERGADDQHGEYRPQREDAPKFIPKDSDDCLHGSTSLSAGRTLEASRAACARMLSSRNATRPAKPTTKASRTRI